MTEGDAVVGAVTETTVFLSYFKDLPDYRQKGVTPKPGNFAGSLREACDPRRGRAEMRGAVGR